jgi:hypothetical protein
MSKLIILLFISFSISVGALENQPCMNKVLIDKFEDIENLEKHLEWHGANNLLIQKAPCKTTKILTNEELSKFISIHIENDNSSGSINGVNFVNESSVLIEAFNKLTTAKDIFGSNVIAANQKNFQKVFSINPECKKVVCAINKIWGKEVGTKMLYILLKHNYNTSEYAFEDSDRLKSDEMEDILMSLEDLPKILIPLGRNNQRLTHYSRGIILKGNNEKVKANGVVMLFDRWSSEPRFERQYTIFHEISHNISRKFDDLDESPEWLALSGWVKKGENWFKSEKACFTSQYSQNNPWEDFAETIATYRYNAKSLKKTCPAKYNFAKNKVFKGLEYLSNETCRF